MDTPETDGRVPTAPVPFSEMTLAMAWLIAGGRCQCSLPSHGHGSLRCRNTLDWRKRGTSTPGAWQAWHKNQDRGHLGDSLHNCEIRCWECGTTEWRLTP
jgi:hypothetical protein